MKKLGVINGLVTY